MVLNGNSLSKAEESNKSTIHKHIKLHCMPVKISSVCVIVMRKLTIQGQYFSRNLFPLPIYSHLHSFSEFYVLLDNQTCWRYSS